ncbi:MAG TPA: hypothetical protein VEC60_12705 [Reyranella sp.]|nr:hypothetical protein [Reyranella sp.]
MRSVAAAAVVIAAGFGPVPAYAGTWMTDARSGCTVWDPLPVPEQTIQWTGRCRDGKASGAGVLTIFRAGKLVERDEGEFVDGKQTGHGSRHYRDGQYAGDFKDGLFDGNGVYVASNGMRYDGEWKAGNFDGHGTLSFASGVRYEGQFRANTFSGHGRLILPDGARYDGEYRLNTPHGMGVYRDANGAIFAGQWTNGCFRDGDRTAHLGVFAEDCGLSAEASVAQAESSDPRQSREN